VAGVIVVWVGIDQLGGWAQLYETGLPEGVEPGDMAPHKMHLHLPADHEILPWIAIIGMNLLNLNYWGANQVILQRALAAKSLRHAQVGLLVGGIFKYLMVLIVIIPGIALVGILVDAPLGDPDSAYLHLVNDLLPNGVRGIILCGLLASLMSSVDSTFNSVSTLWSIDVYKRHLRPNASDAEVVSMGKKAIVVTLFAGLVFSFIQLYVKYTNPEFALTHWFNEISYYVKNGFVVLIVSAVFLIKPSRRVVLAALGVSIALYFLGSIALPDMNYLVRSSFVIVIAFTCVAVPTMIKNGWRIPLRQLVESPDKGVARFGLALLASLILTHILFH
jgi:SSS family solute:Na+ symporter